jgi:hypothetical protein
MTVGGGAPTTELWQWSELDAVVEESKRELETEGRRCGSDRGSLGVYIMAGGAPERG